jgi:hypothetical protein
MIPSGNKDYCKFKEISPRQIGGLTNKNGDWLGIEPRKMMEECWYNEIFMEYELWVGYSRKIRYNNLLEINHG